MDTGQARKYPGTQVIEEPECEKSRAIHTLGLGRFLLTGGEGQQKLSMCNRLQGCWERKSKGPMEIGRFYKHGLDLEVIEAQVRPGGRGWHQGKCQSYWQF